MTISDQIQSTGTSTQRMTTWRGMDVFFNKKKTKFYTLAEMLTKDVSQYDSNGGRIVKARELTLDEHEIASLLNCWRAGKAQWCLERDLPVSKI